MPPSRIVRWLGGMPAPLPLRLAPLALLTVPTIAAPFARWTDDRLELGNERIVRHFAIREHRLHPVAIDDPARGLSHRADDAPALPSWEGAPAATALAIRSAEVPESPLFPAHLKVEAETTFPDLTLHQAFEVHPGVAAVRMTWWVRVHPEADPDRLAAFERSWETIDRVALPGPHWRLRAVEFFDRTDERDTLVEERSRLAFNHDEVVRGNLAWAQPLGEEHGLFLLKEAPSSESQLGHRGYDFRLDRKRLEAVGPGLPLTELEPDRTYSGHGVVAGVYGEGFDGMRIALREYQKTNRVHRPERDAMLMMNTWGDRNRDARINDAFLRTEIDAAARLGLTHFQIDDGWQQGLSQNSAQRAGRKWARWEPADWEPHAARLPAGLGLVSAHAADRGIALGLWFNPTRADSYATWEQDAAIVLDLHRRHGVRYFKIDGVELPDKAADDRFRRFCDRVVEGSDGAIVLHLDATAGRRPGYHYLNHYGVVFLENRYTDWANHYPHATLRNLWMLAHYVPPERLQIEFLNLWRNADRYDPADPLAPARVPFAYAFAVTMMAQPLAWFEASGLPEEAFAIAPLVRRYRELQPEIHRGIILPLGAEPDGHGWTGFQSRGDDTSGFLLILREHDPAPESRLRCLLPAGREVELDPVWPEGPTRRQRVAADRTLAFALPSEFSFELLRYRVLPGAVAAP